MMSDRFWWRWLAAAAALLWLGMAAVTAWNTGSWFECIATFLMLVLGGGLAYVSVRITLGLLHTVTLAPIFWALELRSGSQHGSARFARWREVRRDWLTSRGSVYLGQYRDPLGNLHPLTRDGKEHVLLLGPSRSGKGIGAIIPTCLEWPGSTLIHDEKNEIFATTSAYRASLGKVVRFAAAETDSDCFNPLDVIPEGEGDIGTALSIATTLVEGEGVAHGEAAHWQVGATELIAAVAIYVRATQPGAGLGDVVNALSNPTQPADHLFADMVDHPHPFVAGIGRSQLDRAERERASVTSSALRYLQPWRDPIVARNTASSSFSLDELAAATQPMSLYLCTRPNDAARLRPVMRLMLALVTQHLMSRTPTYAADGSPTTWK